MTDEDELQGLRAALETMRAGYRERGAQLEALEDELNALGFQYAAQGELLRKKEKDHKVVKANMMSWRAEALWYRAHEKGSDLSFSEMSQDGNPSRIPEEIKEIARLYDELREKLSGACQETSTAGPPKT